ncbi:hypothetical protein RSAG8_03549, partial [Rhizoctonia solani AG-8 WAC10335]
MAGVNISHVIRGSFVCHITSLFMGCCLALAIIPVSSHSCMARPWCMKRQVRVRVCLRMFQVVRNITKR